VRDHITHDIQRGLQRHQHGLTQHIERRWRVEYQGVDAA
jgi:hypothetical protein